jgi:hypothetical protein
VRDGKDVAGWMISEDPVKSDPKCVFRRYHKCPSVFSVPCPPAVAFGDPGAHGPQSTRVLAERADAVAEIHERPVSEEVFADDRHRRPLDIWALARAITERWRRRRLFA